MRFGFQQLKRLLGAALLATAMLVAQFAISGTALAETAVNNIRFGQHADKIRVVLDLSGSVDFSIFQLPDPYRIVLDLPQVEFKLPEGTGSNRVGPISGWRHGLFAPGTSRVVIDASKPLSVKSAFLLPPGGVSGYRLVVDLVKLDRETFITKSNESVRKKMAALAPKAPSSESKPVASKPKKDPRKVVVIDPGHGGIDPGAIGVSGIYEKTIALKTAKLLKKELEATGRYRVVMTREADVFIRLRNRIAIAREAKGDLFISLHADSINMPALRGFSVYTLSETASDSEAAALAARENKSDIIAGMDFSVEEPEVTGILIDLAQRQTMNLSVRMAGYVVNQLRTETQMLNKPHRFAGFAVLKAPDIPSILVELGFLSNLRDEKALSDPAHRARLAKGLAQSVDDYFHGVQSAFR